MHDRHICIITWWDNNERDISFVSAEAVHKALKKLWYTNISLLDYPHEKKTLIDHCQGNTIQFARVMIHGVWGEDGEVQKTLDQYSVPYQTAPADIMHLTMDKYLTKLEWKKAWLPVARSLIIDSFVTDVQDVHFDILEKIKYPCIAKDTREWSSFGITILHNKDDLHIRRSAKNPKRQYLIEQFAKGKEITVGVRDTNEWTQALPPIWIRHNQEIWNTQSKYDPKTEELCPAPLPEEELQSYKDLALKAYTSVGMSKYGRVDMIATDNGPILLEINTIPGFTPTSLFPKSAKVSWYSFEEVVEKLMKI